MENDVLDRLRELLAKDAERRRAGRWRFVRKLGAFMGISGGTAKRYVRRSIGFGD